MAVWHDHGVPDDDLDEAGRAAFDAIERQEGCIVGLIRRDESEEEMRRIGGRPPDVPEDALLRIYVADMLVRN